MSTCRDVISESFVGIPKDEIVWLVQTTQDNERYICTSKKSREIYFLYKITKDGIAKKIKTGKNPEKLTEGL